MSAYTVFLILSFFSRFFYSIIFTVDLVYHVTTVGLDPLQLVLVGTTLELTAFTCEIPTGVVADAKSRKLSIIIGTILVGSGFVIEGFFPYFLAIFIAQLVWGLGYTFTSGATQAWIADEIDSEAVSNAFIRGAQAGKIGDLIGIPISVALASIMIQLPIALGGFLMMLLGFFLIFFMPETGFKPTPREDRTHWGSMKGTVRDARQVAKRQPILMSILVIGLFYGLYSEGVDRLWQAHLLHNFTFPSLGALKPVVWFGIIRIVALTLVLIGTEITRRCVDTRHSNPIIFTLLICSCIMIAALAGFALSSLFGWALVFFWCFGTARGIIGPFYEIWLNQRIDDPSVRATMFSVSGQADALGQICGGPGIGAIAKLISIRAALLTSASLLLPVLPLYGLTLRLKHKE